MTDAVCRFVNQWIESYRDELYLAVPLDKLLELMNSYLEEVGGDGVSEVTKEDVKKCLGDTVEIVSTKGGREVLWLWGGRRLRDMVGRVAELADRWGEVAATAI
jgi:hypothetical protein